MFSNLFRNKYLKIISPVADEIKPELVRPVFIWKKIFQESDDLIFGRILTNLPPH